MKDVELYAKVRHAVRIEGLSERAAVRQFGVDPRTVDKMLAFSVPPGYRRSKPKLGPFIAIIDGILAGDIGPPKTQQHTAKRIFKRLRDEHGFTGGITIAKDYVAGRRQQSQEVFVPVSHDATLLKNRNSAVQVPGPIPAGLGGEADKRCRLAQAQSKVKRV